MNFLNSYWGSFDFNDSLFYKLYRNKSLGSVKVQSLIIGQPFVGRNFYADNSPHKHRITWIYYSLTSFDWWNNLLTLIFHSNWEIVSENNLPPCKTKFFGQLISNSFNSRWYIFDQQVKCRNSIYRFLTGQLIRVKNLIYEADVLELECTAAKKGKQIISGFKNVN